VQVFLFRVDEELERWPEAAIRGRIWVSPQEAAVRVREAELQPLLTRLPDLLAHAGAEQDWLIIEGFREAQG
jgi:molybdopterin-guanine dinucleotide biosynthesis protein